MIDIDVEYCPHCVTEIDYVANTCNACGGKMTEGGSYCPYCGEYKSSLYCYECGEEITEEDVERYNQLSDEDKIALPEAYLQKKAEEEAKAKVWREKLKEKDKLRQERIALGRLKRPF